MPKDEKKYDGIQNESTLQKYMHNNLSTENVVVPTSSSSGVKILSRGDLLGAINCLFPELHLKSSHIKLKENFSLFSYSPQELTSIFESGRKYRTRIMKNVKNPIGVLSLRPQSNRTNLKSTSFGNSSTKNVVLGSNTWKSKSQSKQNIFQTKSAKRHELVHFETHYTDFLTKFLELHFPGRYNDFKNIECLIQELHNLHKQISKSDKIAPFNPNLPVLNISECDKVALRMGNSPMEKLKKKSSTSTKHIRNKKGPLAHKSLKIFKSQNEARGSEKILRKTLKRCNLKIKESPSPSSKQTNVVTKNSFVDDFDDEFGKIIAKNLEDLLDNDSFTPRYESKHTSDMFLIFQKPLNENDVTASSSDAQLEREAIDQYQNSEESMDMQFNLLEIQAKQQYEDSSKTSATKL